MSKGRVLITGGAGFIGSHLTDQLLAQDFDVYILDNLTPQVHQDLVKDNRGWPLYLHRGAQRFEGDVGDAGLLAAILAHENITHVVHLAASVGVGQSMSNIVEYARNNTLNTAVLLEVLSKGNHRVERLIVASSMSVYGEGAYRSLATGETVYPSVRSKTQIEDRRWELELDGEILEPTATSESKVMQPASIYAIGKRDQEEMCLVMGRALGIPTIALRLFNTYGSRQALGNPYTGVAANFMSRLMNDKAPLIFEDGNQRRDFIHVSDTAAAFVAVLESNTPVWDVYNVGTGEPVTIKQVARLLSQLTGKNLKPELLGTYRVGDVRHCYADAGKLRNAFGWHANTSFEKGMRELLISVHGETAVDRSAESMGTLAANGMVV
jgi:dTDP-L-rhamnose 4-epimerase